MTLNAQFIKRQRRRSVNNIAKMHISTKVAFVALFFTLLGIKTGSSLTSADLFSSMDNARGALLSFYQPNVAQKRKSIGSKGKLGLTGNKGLDVLTKQSKLTVNKVHKLTVNKVHILSVNKVHKLTVNKVQTVLTGNKRRPLPTTSGDTKSAVKSQKPVFNNKFLEALEDIEKALADAQQVVGRVTHNAQRLRKLQDLIKTAVKKRSYRFARKLIGEAMYTIIKIKEQSTKTGRGKRQTIVSTTNFLGNLRQSIGDAAFNELLAMQGQVTLMFAIDKTGSMQEEIDTAKKIAQSIVDQNRVHPVDYILSPFSDPGKIFRFNVFFPPQLRSGGKGRDNRPPRYPPALPFFIKL